MTICREFYHKMFSETMADILQPIFYDIIMCDYKILSESVSEEDLLPLFKSFLIKKIEEVKERKKFDYFTIISKKIKDIDKFAELCQAININFVKMNVVGDAAMASEVSQSDIYAITLIEVYSTLNINSYLFLRTICMYEHEKRKSCIYNKIWKAIIKGLNKAMSFNLIPEDKIFLINNIKLNIGNKLISFDKERLLEIFNKENNVAPPPQAQQMQSVPPQQNQSAPPQQMQPQTQISIPQQSQIVLDPELVELTKQILQEGPRYNQIKVMNRTPLHSV